MTSQPKSTKITEAINLNEVSCLLIQQGYMVYRPEADVDGIDFLVASPDESILKCQLKGRAFVQWDKYGGKKIHMVFPNKGEKDDTGLREWYLVPHDELFSILKDRHGHAPKWNHPKLGEYWSCPSLSKSLAEKLERFKIKNLKKLTS